VWIWARRLRNRVRVVFGQFVKDRQDRAVLGLRLAGLACIHQRQADEVESSRLVALRA
jgi:hypothetical protein